jgi:hypothetical protein
MHYHRVYLGVEVRVRAARRLCRSLRPLQEARQAQGLHSSSAAAIIAIVLARSLPDLFYGREDP